MTKWSAKTVVDIGQRSARVPPTMRSEFVTFARRWRWERRAFEKWVKVSGIS
jgi:hypothetical protein